MKRNIQRLLTSLSLLLAAQAQAQEWCPPDPCCYEETCCPDETAFYAKIFGGANFLQNTKITDNKTTYETGYIVAGSLGYCWCYGVRLEAEYAFRRNSINKIDFYAEGSSKNGHFQTSSYMGNLLWDLPLASWGCALWNIQPFIGAGIGYDFQQMHASNSRIDFDQKWHHFSWQLMGGLAYPIFCNTELSLEYKYHEGGSHFYNHSVGVGLLYKIDCLKHNR